ncbi:MAG: hypothetical protein ACOY94_13120 [Bacillota bacterium]
MKLVSISRAARLLGIDPGGLRRRETPDGRYCEVYGHRIKVFRVDLGPGAQRRYDEDEIQRVLARMSKSR